MADAFNEEDAQLWLLRLDVLHKKLPPVDGAVRGIQNAHSAALVEEIVQELVERVESHLLAQLGRGFILGVEEPGRLVHLGAACRAIEVERRWFTLHDDIGASSAL